MVAEQAGRTSRHRRHPHRVPTRVIAIACLARSGSTLLAEAFTATGVAGRCDEVLNGHVVFEGTRRHGDLVAWARLRLSNLLHRVRTGQLRGDPYVGRRLVLQHLDRYAGRMMSDDGVLVVKLFWTHYRLDMVDHGLDMGLWGAPVVWIRLVRTDRLAQAVSSVRAQQSQQWLWNQRAVRSVTYDADAITRELNVITEREHGWDDYFRRLGESPLVVTYEDLDQHYEATVRRVFDHVGMADVAVPPQQLRRQRDEVSDEWIRRYLAEHPDAGHTD